ncbi:hypothetical protein ACK3TF_004334 [Chlorella vulgaris]
MLGVLTLISAQTEMVSCAFDLSGDWSVTAKRLKRTNMFLVAIGAGAAVMEVHRALLHRGNGDTKELQEKEAALRKQLQDLQRDLRATQQRGQLTEQEAAQLAAVNLRLSAENADLAAASSSLKAENEALASRADSLLERQAALESAAESLKLENCTLLQQFDQLKLQYHQEASGFQEQVAELKSAVSGALGRFTSGDISADQLMAYLGAMGVELRCRLLDSVDVGGSWMAQMRLASAEPQLTARLLMAGAAAARNNTSGGQASAAALTDGASNGPVPAHAAAAGSSSAPATTTAALTYTKPTKLPTPPKGRPAAQLPHLPGSKVPPLKLAGVGGGPATAPVASTAADENAAGNALEPTAAADKEASGTAKGKKSGSMRFVPGKKPVRKQAVPSATPQLALDLPLSARGEGSSALPRLPFEAASDDGMDMLGGGGGGGRSVMAL